MKLFLDSGNKKEIEYYSDLGLIEGVTTTPTILAREGSIDVDKTLLQVSNLVDLLHVEALGNTSDDIIAEVQRLESIGLPMLSTVFKIPISNHGLKACKLLTNAGYLVNVHLTYTLQQVYLALEAGATYVCPLVGRLEDQGGDALGLLRDAVEVKNKYSYKSNIMFSSVRNTNHVKQALNIGVDAITVPGSILKVLPDHHLTTLHIAQFEKDNSK